MTGFAVWGVANYHIKAIERTYGISGEEYRDFKQSIGTLNQIPEVHEFLSTMIIGVILILAPYGNADDSLDLRQPSAAD